MTGTALGVMLGDSIVSQMQIAGRVKLCIPPNDTATSKVLALAVAGWEVGQMYTSWLGSTGRGNPRTKWVFFQGGINDILHGQLSAAQIEAKIDQLIADIQTSTPWATIYMAKMDPCHAYLDTVGADRYPRYQAVDAYLAATYPSIYHTDIHDALADGNDDFQTIYGGQVLHPNTTGDGVAVDTFKAWLVATFGSWA